MRVETGTEAVLAELADGVATITLNRPERRNALHPDMYVAVPVLLERFDADPAVGCIVLTGAGPSFCAGGDVRDGRRPTEDGHEPTVEEAAARLTEDARMVVLLHELSTISIAALPGPAGGAGLAIALAADLRIAAASARLIPGWGALGFSGDFGGTWSLTRLVGPGRALEILIDDRTVGMDEALALGLVNRVVSDDDLRAEAHRWAAAIAAGSAPAQAFMKANVQQAATLPLREALLNESERMARTARTDEHRAAVRAWLTAAKAKRASGRQQGTTQ
jgi:2-(1,2-epoxy-1,2-dihydrophenyl)acetyl-CoA isomerase